MKAFGTKQELTQDPMVVLYSSRFDSYLVFQIIYQTKQKIKMRKVIECVLIALLSASAIVCATLIDVVNKGFDVNVILYLMLSASVLMAIFLIKKVRGYE